MSWGTVEERSDEGKFIAYHTVPLVDIGGEGVPSEFHDASCDCPCHPFAEKSEAGNWNVWMHHDPDHAGALSEDEFLQRKIQAAQQFSSVN